jgi:hypothetical protein
MKKGLIAVIVIVVIIVVVIIIASGGNGEAQPAPGAGAGGAGARRTEQVPEMPAEDIEKAAAARREAEEMARQAEARGTAGE